MIRCHKDLRRVDAKKYLKDELLLDVTTADPEKGRSMHRKMP